MRGWMGFWVGEGREGGRSSGGRCGRSWGVIGRRTWEGGGEDSREIFTVILVVHGGVDVLVSEELEGKWEVVRVEEELG